MKLSVGGEGVGITWFSLHVEEDHSLSPTNQVEQGHLQETCCRAVSQPPKQYCVCLFLSLLAQ